MVEGDKQGKPEGGAEFLTPSEVETMMATTSSTRNKAMLAVGFEAGLRASELLNMHVGDVAFDERGASIRVRERLEKGFSD
ncbi:MAG: tyrosine-type recombinase/integrase [Nitrososphaerota archaeon]